MARIGWLPMIGVLMLAVTARAEAAADPDAGAQVFGTSAACHTLEPGAHRTGPSLAGVLGRKAGTASDLAWLLTYRWRASPAALSGSFRPSFFSA
jgi:cytochrome c2